MEPTVRDELRALLPPRVLAYAGVGIILLAAGGPAAVASYRHAWTVAERYGGDPTMAPWLPLTTDGMIAAALTTIVVRRVLRQPTGAWPVIAALLGFAATIAANLAAVSTSTWLDDWAVPIVAIWPPIATAITLELVVTLLRPRVSTPAVKSVGTNPRPDLQPVHSEPAAFADLDAVFDPARLGPALERLGRDADVVQLAKTQRGITAAAERAAAVDKLTDDDRRIIAEIEQRLADNPAAPALTARAVRSEYGLGKPRADRIFRALTAGLTGPPIPQETPS